MTFRLELNARYWAYRRERFPDWQRYFDRDWSADDRPPVFQELEAHCNVLSNPLRGDQGDERLLALIPRAERHRWFRSMHSSQALAQSVLGNLAIFDQMSSLADMQDDEGESLFGAALLHRNTFSMEYPINYLGESGTRITKIDGFVSGDYRVAIECKFIESEVGSCSRPRLTENDTNFKQDHCNGTFSVQRERTERCSLTEVGIRYWEFIPHLFTWIADVDLRPCPLRMNYQLVRNILAVGVRRDGSVSQNEGHVILIYDARNPAFNLAGKGLKAYIETREALRRPSMLRKCSWQRIVDHLRDKGVLGWLTEELALKYGL